MYFKSTSNKADGVKKMMEIFPSAFSIDDFVREDVLPENALKGDVVLVDALQILYCFCGINGRDLIRLFKLRIDFAFANGANCVILAFDRSDHVPISKGWEQQSRDVGPAKKKDDESFFEPDPDLTDWKDFPDPGLWLDRPVPSNFSSGLHDRMGYRKMILRFVTSNLLACDDPMLKPNVAVGKSLIISGHEFDEASWRSNVLLRDVDFDFSSLKNDSRYDGEGDPRDYPVRLTIEESDDDELAEECTIVNFVPELANRIGEAELAVLFYANALSEYRCPEIWSTDSDVLFYMLAFVAKAKTSPGYNLPESMIWTSSLPFKSPRKTCDVIKLVECIKQKNHAFEYPKFRHHPEGVGLFDERDPIQRVWQLVATQCAAGTDYTQGFQGVTHAKFFDAIMAGSRSIGHIYENGKFSFRSYERLCVSANALGRFRVTEASAAKRSAKRVGDYIPDKSDVMAPTTWSNLRTIVRVHCNAKNTAVDRRFPEKFDHRYARFVEYVKMLNCVGLREVASSEDPRTCGYGPTETFPTREDVHPLED